MKTSSLAFGCLLLPFAIQAQNIAINTSGAAANAYALLDVGTAGGGDTKGLLIPRVSLSATNNNAPIGSWVNGLVVYNLASAGSWPTNVVANNFYYSDGSQWVRINGNPNGDWNLSGNALTGASASAPNEWIGSSNAYDWVVKTNGTERMRVFSTGDVSIGTSTQLTNFLYVRNSQNAATGVYAQNVNTGASAFGEVAAASDQAQGTLLAFSSAYTNLWRRQRAALQAEVATNGLDLVTMKTTGDIKFYPGGVYNAANNNVPGGTDIFRVMPPTVTNPNGMFGIIEGGGTPTKYTYFQGGNQTADVTYTLPVDDGTSSQVLTTDGSGVLSWTTPSAASSGGCTGDWTLVAVANMTCCGSSGDVWSGFTMASNKEYLVVPVGYSAGSELFTLTTGDAVAVFGPGYRINNAVTSQDEVIAFFASPGGNFCSNSSYSGFIRIAGKLKSTAAALSGLIIQYGGNNNTVCGTPSVWIILKATGEIGVRHGDTNADVGLYIFER